MEITANTLRQQYEILKSERLLELQAGGTLTALAQAVIEQVLDERGVSYRGKERPEKPASIAPRVANDATRVETAWDTVFWTLVSWWGVLFRTVFIAAVGIASYLWFDPKAIGDVPFAQLTLNQVFENLIAILVAGACIWWFFSFPDRANATTSRSNPYVVWGQLGGYFVLFAAGAYYILVNWK